MDRKQPSSISAESRRRVSRRRHCITRYPETRDIVAVIFVKRDDQNDPVCRLDSFDRPAYVVCESAAGELCNGLAVAAERRQRIELAGRALRRQPGRRRSYKDSSTGEIVGLNNRTYKVVTKWNAGKELSEIALEVFGRARNPHQRRRGLAKVRRCLREHPGFLTRSLRDEK
jgi:hypothetical protein